MKKINLAAMLLVLSAFTGIVSAEMAFQSSQDVQGAWKLEYTKKTASSTEKIAREDSWAFSGDKVTITHIPREGIYYDQTPVNYLIEDGKLKISLLGRSDKFDTFSLVERDDKSMTLKGKYGDIYHFIKK